jgi:hypothetical protein
MNAQRRPTAGRGHRRELKTLYNIVGGGGGEEMLPGVYVKYQTQGIELNVFVHDNHGSRGR